MDTQGPDHLLLQSMEHERSAVAVYRAALRCVVDDALREEWEQYLAETRGHVDVLSELCDAFRVDSAKDTGSPASRWKGRRTSTSTTRDPGPGSFGGSG